MRKRYPHKPSLSVVSSQSASGLNWTTPSNDPKSSEPNSQNKPPSLSLPFTNLPRKPIAPPEPPIYSDHVGTQSQENSFSPPNLETRSKTPPSRSLKANPGLGRPSLEMGQQSIANHQRDRSRRSGRSSDRQKNTLIKRSGSGFRNFENFRIRCLLNWHFT